MLVGDEHPHLPRLLDLRPLRHLGLRHLPVRPSLQRADPLRTGGGLMRAAVLALAIGLCVLGAGITTGAYLHVGYISDYDQRPADVQAQAAHAVAAAGSLAYELSTLAADVQAQAAHAVAARTSPAAKDAQAAYAVAAVGSLAYELSALAKEPHNSIVYNAAYIAWQRAETEASTNTSPEAAQLRDRLSAAKNAMDSRNPADLARESALLEHMVAGR